MKEGETMTILEVIAVITLAFTVLMYGFWIGINAKNDRRVLRKPGNHFLEN